MKFKGINYGAGIQFAPSVATSIAYYCTYTGAADSAIDCMARNLEYPNRIQPGYVRNGSEHA